MTKKYLQKLFKPKTCLDKGKMTTNEVAALRKMFTDLNIFGSNASRADSAFYHRVFNIGFRAYEIEGIVPLTNRFIDEQALTGKVKADKEFWSKLSASEREAYISFMAEYDMGLHLVTQRIPQMRFDEWELQGLRNYTKDYQ